MISLPHNSDLCYLGKDATHVTLTTLPNWLRRAPAPVQKALLWPANTDDGEKRRLCSQADVTEVLIAVFFWQRARQARGDKLFFPFTLPSRVSHIEKACDSCKLGIESPTCGLQNLYLLKPKLNFSLTAHTLRRNKLNAISAGYPKRRNVTKERERKKPWLPVRGEHPTGKPCFQIIAPRLLDFDLHLFLLSDQALAFQKLNSANSWIVTIHWISTIKSYPCQSIVIYPTAIYMYMYTAISKNVVKIKVNIP